MSSRRRLAGAALLFLVLVVLAFASPVLSVPIVSAGLILAPTVNWRAWWRLRGKLRQSITDRPPGSRPLEALATTTDTAFYLALGSTVTAALGILIGLRLLLGSPPLPREVVVIALSYPPLLATGPAFAWLDLVARMERDEVADAKREGIRSATRRNRR